MVVPLSQAELLEVFEDAGNTVRWKLRKKGIQFGKLASSVTGSGHLCVQYKGSQRAVHRVLWVMRNGEIPEGMWVDHIDGNTLNNQPGNLRLARPCDNNRNRRMNRNNTSGYKDVTWNKKSRKWQVQICNGNGQTYFGSFDKVEDAGKAAARGRELLHGEFYNHGFGL